MAKAQTRTTIMCFVHPSIRHDVSMFIFFIFFIWVMLTIVLSRQCLPCSVYLYKLPVLLFYFALWVYLFACNVFCICSVCVLLACFSVPWLQWVHWLIIVHQTSGSLLSFSLSLCACPPLTALNIVSTLLVTHIHKHYTHTHTQWINYMQHHISSLSKCGVWCSHPT